VQVHHRLLECETEQKAFELSRVHPIALVTANHSQQLGQFLGGPNELQPNLQYTCRVTVGEQSSFFFGGRAEVNCTPFLPLPFIPPLSYAHIQLSPHLFSTYPTFPINYTFFHAPQSLSFSAVVSLAQSESHKG